MRKTAEKEGTDPKPFERQAAALDAELGRLRGQEKKLPAVELANGVRDAGTWVSAADPV